MTISPFAIYLWQLVDQLRAVIGPLTIIGSLCIVVTLVSTGEINLKKHPWGVGVGFSSWVMALTLSVFVPTSKTVAMMVVIPAIANSEVIQRDMPEIYKLAIDKLKEQLQLDQKK